MSPGRKQLEAGNGTTCASACLADAPDRTRSQRSNGAFGYVHSYETSSRYDGLALRAVCSYRGCLRVCTLRPQSRYVHLRTALTFAQQVLHRLAGFRERFCAHWMVV